jgi:hypothetical protein
MYVADAGSPAHPEEVIPEILVRADRHVRLDDFGPVMASADLWRGLVLVGTSSSDYLVRWTNISADRKYAKRLELVQQDASGKEAVISQAWGPFDIAVASKLSLKWSDQRISVSTDNRLVCSAPVTAPLSDQVGLVSVRHPVVLFAEFAINAFSNAGASERTMAQSAGVGNSTVGKATPVDKMQNHAYSKFIAPTDAIVTIMPTCHFKSMAIQTGISSSETPDEIELFHHDGQEVGLRFHSSTFLPTNHFWVAESIHADEKSIWQLRFAGDELRIYADGVLAASCLRSRTGSIGEIGVAIVGDNVSAPRFSVAMIDSPSKMVHSLVRPFDSCALSIWGDLLIEAFANPVPIDEFSLALRTDDESTPNEYRVLVKGGATSSVKLEKDGVRLMLGGPDDHTKLQSFGVGLNNERISIFRNGKWSQSYWDSNSQRRHQIKLNMPRVSTPDIASIELKVAQDSDWHCDFESIGLANQALGLWRKTSGTWQIQEEVGKSFLRGTTGEGGRAALVFDEKLKPTDILVQARIARELLTPSKKFSISILGSRTMNSETTHQTLSIGAVETGKLRWQASCGEIDRQELVNISNRSSDTMLVSVLRTADSFQFMLDCIPIAALKYSPQGVVSGVSVALDGSPGDDIWVRSVDILESPLSRFRTSPGSKLQLELGVDALTN